jgi:hypothetical protein
MRRGGNMLNTAAAIAIGIIAAVVVLSLLHII